MNSPNGVLVAGAINTDLVARMTRAPGPGETITGHTFSIHAGGKGANQAVAAARSGAQVMILGAIGMDEFGSGRLEDLRAEAIDTQWVTVVEGVASGVAMIFVEDGGENRIAYVPGATSLVTPDNAERTIREASPRFVLATNELPTETLSMLFAQARQRSIPVILNATPDPVLAEPLLEYVDILIVNHGEALALVGPEADADIGNLIDRLGHLGPHGVVVTLGPDGAIGRIDERRFHLKAPTVRVVDTTGAGDTFCGVLVAQMLAGSELMEAARRGVHAAALAVTRAGAQPSIPDGDMIQQFVAASVG